MANVINLPSPELYRPEFDDMYEIEYQQTIANADGLFEKVVVSGEYKEFPLLAKTSSARKITKRFEETAPGTVDAGKRRVSTDPYVDPLIFDRVDEKKFGTLESQIGPSIQNQRYEAARNMDEVIIGTAGERGGLIGLATEVSSAGVVSYPAFDATYTIPVNFAYGVTSGPNKGMSYDKITHLMTKLAKFQVRSQGNTTNNPSAFFGLLGASQIEDMLQDSKYNNRDSATAAIEQVARGEIVDVNGVTLRVIDDSILPIDGGGIRTCIFGAKRGARFGWNDQLNHELDRLPTKTHAIQSTLYWDWGLGRIWDQAIWKIPCLEA
jgi:hypothetical protein